MDGLKHSSHGSDSKDGPVVPSSSLSKGPKTYRIVNAQTGTCAALLNDNDREEIANMTLNLKDNTNSGSEWFIIHLGRDQYKLENAHFKSFAAYGNRPGARDQVFVRSEPVAWIIRPTGTENFYTISPPENPDLFWMSVDDLDGTPLELGRVWSARKCQWLFQSVEENQRPSASPIVPYAQSIPLDYRTLLKDLPTVATARYDTDPRKVCLEGTRVKLRQDIRDWVANPDSTMVFWLCGQAGTGKTTIALTVADELKRQEQLGASFIFSRFQQDRSELQHVFTTIAEELSRRHEPFGACLAAAMAKEGAAGSLLPTYQFERFIVNPLARCRDFPTPIVIVIDALDECKDEARLSALLEILHKHLKRSMGMKFIITSRPEVHIREAFNRKLKDDTTFIKLHDIESTMVDKDISAYLHSSFAEGTIEYEYLADVEWPSEADIATLVARCAQLFIYAATVIRLIFDPAFSDPQAQLTYVLDSPVVKSGMETLDQLYLHILVATSPPNSAPEIHRRLIRILGAIFVLAYPLSPEDLESLLGLGRGQVRVSLRHLHSVLVVPDKTSQSPIRILHKSFSDFLTTRCRDSRFQVDTRVCHEDLANCCLVMSGQISQLSGFWRSEIGASFANRESQHFLVGPSQKNQNVFPRDDAPMGPKIDAALRYACRNWVMHASEASRDVAQLGHVQGVSSS